MLLLRKKARLLAEQPSIPGRGEECKWVFTKKFAAEGGIPSFGGENTCMDIEMLNGRLAQAEANLLTLDGRLDEVLRRLEEWGQNSQPGQMDELLTRLAVLEAERAKLSEEARIAEAEAQQAQAEAVQAEAEAISGVAEAIAEEEAEEEEIISPSLEVIEAPEETNSSQSQGPKKSASRSDWENLGLNL